MSFVCPSCGTESAGTFCRNCGERKLGSEDRSLRHYLDIVVNYLTHFDTKGYRTLWLLVTRPGFLSSEQLRGSRVRYAKPFSLFLSLNVVYYVSVAWFGASTFTTPLDTQLRLNDYYPAYARARVAKKMQEEAGSYPALEARFNEKAGVLSKTLVFLFIPIYALLFFALYFRERKYVMEHVVVATHFWCFVLVLLAVGVPAVAAPFWWWTRAPSFEAVFVAGEVPLTIGLQLVIGVYLALMLRRVYGARLWYCVLVAAAIAWSFFHIVWLYRFLLFEITLRLV